MHGTGTPLGDPIEVAAGLAALRSASVHTSGRAPQRLALMASKSQAGHCEPAAGLVGLTAAVAAISGAALAPVLHLRSLNPYVEAALDGAGTASAARMPGPWANALRLPLACSVSSFAFQVGSLRSPVVLVHSRAVALRAQHHDATKYVCWVHSSNAWLPSPRGHRVPQLPLEAAGHGVTHPDHHLL